MAEALVDPRARLALSDDCRSYQAVVRGFLSSLQPAGRVRELMATDVYDRECWSRLAQQTGAASVGVPPEEDGSGGGLAELAVVFEELGRSLAVVPALATVAMARTAVMHSGELARKECLPGLMDGSVTATVALDASGLHAVADGPDRLRLSGVLPRLLDGATADLILALVSDDRGPTLVALSRRDKGVATGPIPTLDLTRKFGTVRLSDARAVVLGEPGTGRAALDAAIGAGRVLLAAELLGVSQACLDAAVSHAGTRVQFGRVLGSFQAIKHRCADMYAAVATTRTAVRYAAAVGEEQSARFTTAAAMAKLAAGEAAAFVTAANLQIHGGLGFTWEHSAHLYLKRAQSMRSFLGGPVELRRELAVDLGLIRSGDGARE